MHGYRLCHIEVTSPDRQPLPITETGYRSMFVSAAVLDAWGGPLPYVRAAIDMSARDPEWIERDARRQMSLTGENRGAERQGRQHAGTTATRSPGLDPGGSMRGPRRMRRRCGGGAPSTSDAVSGAHKRPLKALSRQGRWSIGFKGSPDPCRAVVRKVGAMRP